MVKKLPGAKTKTKKKPLFCTECNKELDLFWLTPKASDAIAVRKNHEKCVSEERFKGEFCSKMFISGEYDMKGMFVEVSDNKKNKNKVIKQK